MRLLGVSAFYHDSAAVLLEDGVVTAAAHEERFSRVKHDAAFPRQALRWCVQQARGPIDGIAYYEKPLLKFERILATALQVAPQGFRAFAAALPSWLRTKLWLPGVIADELRPLGLDRLPVYFSSHHEAHAASAYYPSPFARAAVLTLDGVGEWHTTTLGHGVGETLTLHDAIEFPHSLGLLYSAFTYFCGFRVNSGEYKLMGLAPYGTPRFTSVIRERLIDVKPDGSYRLNLDYFDYLKGERMTNDRFARLFDTVPRAADAPLRQVHCDLAASVQAVTEDVVLALARTLHARTGENDVCLAGGVALNCVANRRLQTEGPFRRVWVQPAAGDAGGALGAALAVEHLHFGRPRIVRDDDGMGGAFLGPACEDAEIVAALAHHGLPAESLTREEWPGRIAELLDRGDVIGLVQGRAEFGPRALGARSILADARDPTMQRRLNLKVKFRESFRPFAPIVLAEEAARWFDLQGDSPYMLFTAPVAAAHRREVPPVDEWTERLRWPHSNIPAVTHVDGSARVQTVDAGRNPAVHAILAAFAERTGCPVLVNTSFNVRGEPPVLTAEDAITGFLATDLDVLVLGQHVLDKRQLPAEVRQRRPRPEFRPD